MTSPEYNYEMGTPTDQLKSNTQVNMNKLVENVENNLENLNTKQNYHVGGYQYEHEQLLNQNKPVQVETFINSIQEPNNKPTYVNKQEPTNKQEPINKPTCYFPFLNKEYILVFLLFCLFSHRKFNMLLVYLFPYVSDPKFYSYFIISKGIIFTILINLFKNF